jgi:cytokinin dehydrogenase
VLSKAVADEREVSMIEGVSRRRIISGLAALAVVGFDPRSRAWITTANAAPNFEGVPPLSGSLFLDAAHRDAAADDFGHLIHATPAAVLLPGSSADVVKMVRYCRRHGIPVAMRGQGHAQYGQAQVEGGLVIDSSSLATIHSLAAAGARVDAGVRWSDLVVAAAEQGLTPPVLTDYLELSVGGTVSVGGIGGGTPHFGVQGDNVLELEVVTGEGELVTCSRHARSELFDAVTSGLGQCALILRATLRLIPAPTRALIFHLYYDDIALYIRDQLRLVRDGRFEYLEGQVVSNSSGGWRYMIEAASLYSPPCTPNEAHLLRGLSDDRASRERSETPYLDFAFRLAPTIEFLKSIGVWGFPHPWLSLFLPASRAGDYVGNLMATLTPADTGQGPILFYPLLQSRVRRPFFRLPDEPVSFAFNILRTAPPDPIVQAAMVASNRALYEAAIAVRGTRYASGAIPMTRADWRRHFGVTFRDFEHAKRRFDPQGILTPGAGIF